MKVVSNTAISLDGRINTRERRFAFFGSARDHARMSRLRAEADAVLVGGATFRNWPHAALPDAADRGRLRGRPWNVVVSRSLDLPHDADFFAEPAVRPLLLTRAAALAGRALPAGAEAEGWPGAGEDLPVAWLLEQLARRGVEHLLVEAGGDLLFQFIAADAIDEMYLTLCPLVVGGDAPSLADGSGFDLAELRRLRLVAAEPVGDEVFLHYRATGR
jgi:5-amino-6-(5-phosphoribosylamino)uracil reductase